MFLRNNLHKNNSEKRLIINNANYMDIDKYRDELIKLKQELNKRNKEYQDLKVEYTKLENEYKSNLKLIELIINESNSNEDLNSSGIINMKNPPNIIDNKNNDINSANDIDNTNVQNEVKKINKFKKKKKSSSLCKETMHKIKEKYLYLKMKEEINHLKEEISEKDTIMNHLKNSSKIIKLRELDNKYADTYHELTELKDKYKKVEYIKQDYYNTKNKLAALFQQLDLYKKQTRIQKEQIEKLTLQQQNNINIIENNENQKNIEENKKKYFKNENEKLKKIIKNLYEKNENFTEEIERLKNVKPPSRNLVKVEMENKKLKQQISEYVKEIEKLKKMLKDKNEDKKLKKNQGDFFMTSTKIIIEEDQKKDDNENDNNNNNDEDNNNNNVDENKNINKNDNENDNKNNNMSCNDISTLNKLADDKKLETKDIELTDLLSENN
jgi:hypothetical protein